MGFLSIAAPIVGGLLGGLGNKGSKQTQTSKPYMPEEYEEGYQDVLKDAKDIYRKPYTPAPTMRYQDRGGLFDSPVLSAIQRAKDEGGLTASDAHATQATAQPVPDMAARALVRSFLMGGNTRGDGNFYMNRTVKGSGMQDDPKVVNALAEFYNQDAATRRNQGINMTIDSPYYKVMQAIYGRG